MARRPARRQPRQIAGAAVERENHESMQVVRTNNRRSQVKSAIVLREERRTGTALSIDPDAAFSDSAIRGFIDDWLVPALVERFVESRLIEQSEEDKRQ